MSDIVADLRLDNAPIDENVEQRHRAECLQPEFSRTLANDAIVREHREPLAARDSQCSCPATN